MKVCKYCHTELEDNMRYCVSCGANEFEHKCSNCGTCFSSAFCPNCGIKANAKAHLCPTCGNTFYTFACPSCGYTLKDKTNKQEENKSTVSGAYSFEKAYVSSNSTNIMSNETKKHTDFDRMMYGRLSAKASKGFGVFFLICSVAFFLGTLLFLVINPIISIIALLLGFVYLAFGKHLLKRAKRIKNGTYFRK